MVFKQTVLAGAVAAVLVSSPATALVVSIEQNAYELATILTAGTSGLTVTHAEILYGSPCGEFGCFDEGYGGEIPSIPVLTDFSSFPLVPAVDFFSSTFSSDVDISPLQATTGTYSNDSGTYNLPASGIVLSTGNVLDYGEGPNLSGGNSTSFNNIATEIQNDLLNPITGVFAPHFDVTQLNITFNVDENTDSISFLTVFGSEEFPEFVGSSFNDGFGLYLNGSNIAGVVPEEGGEPQTVAISHPDMKPIEGTELNGVLAPNNNPILRFDAPVDPGSTGNVLTVIIGDAADDILDTTAYIASLGAEGSSELIPIMPSNGEPDETGAFNFVISVGDSGLGIDTPIWIDPIVAIGYTYEVVGTNFTTVTLPTLASVNDTDGYEVWYFDGTQFVFGANVDAEGSFDFTTVVTGGVSQFQILDIDPALELDPSDPIAFMTGVTFADAGTWSVSMTAITFDTDSNAVPVPATLSLFFFGGLGWLMVAARRRA